MSTTNPTPQLDAIHAALMEIRSSLSSDRLFNLLEVVRDGVSDLSHQIEAVRGDISDLRNLIYQQASAGAD